MQKRTKAIELKVLVFIDNSTFVLQRNSFIMAEEKPDICVLNREQGLLTLTKGIAVSV